MSKWWPVLALVDDPTKSLVSVTSLSDGSSLTRVWRQLGPRNDARTDTSGRSQLVIVTLPPVFRTSSSLPPLRAGADSTNVVSKPCCCVLTGRGDSASSLVASRFESAGRTWFGAYATTAGRLMLACGPSLVIDFGTGRNAASG